MSQRRISSQRRRSGPRQSLNLRDEQPNRRIRSEMLTAKHKLEPKLVKSRVIKCFENMQNELDQDECMQIVRNNKNLIHRLDDDSFIHLLKIMNMNQRKEMCSLMEETCDKIFKTAIFYEDYDKLDVLINSNLIDINNLKYFRYEPPLTLAVKEGKSLKLIKFLLTDGGADPNIEDRKGNTALFYVRNPELAKELINYGANIDHQNYKGNTPLIYVITEGPTTVAKILIQEGANVGLENNKGETAYDEAIKYKYRRSIVLMIEDMRKHA